MGLSTKKTKSTSNETATTTPNVPGYATQPIQNYYGNVSDFQQNPSAYTTPTNMLQNEAYGNAMQFGGGNAVDRAISATGNLLNYGTASNPYQTGNGNRLSLDMPGQSRAYQLQTAALPDQYDPALMGDPGARQVAYGQAGALGNPAMAGYTGYAAPQLGGPSMAQAAQLGDPALAQLRGYSAPQLGDANTVDLRGYDANQVGDVGQYLNGNVERAQAASLLDNFDAYHNPATGALVDTTLANYDDYAGRQQAAYERMGAANNAFGGSSFAIGEAQMNADLARQRAATEAGLRYDAFNTAAGLSNLDAGRRQDASVFNAGQQNARDALSGQLGYQGAMFNAGAQNDAARYGADAYNQGQLFNAGAQNQFDLTQAGFDEAAARYGADAYNRGQELNTGYQNQFALTGADYQQQANMANAGYQNQFALTQAGLNADAAQFGANASNTAALANAGYQNQYGLAQFDANNQFGLANQAAQNQAYGQQYDAQQAAAAQNAAAQNAARSQFYGTEADMNRFNADLALRDRGQNLDAANQLANLSLARDASMRADTALQSDIGGQRYAIDQAQNPLALLAAQGALLDPALLGTITGQTITSQGTSTSKQSGGLFGDILGGLFGLGAAAIGKK